MKKLMGISVIAMLAVAAGFSAHAADGDPVPGAPTHLASGTTITGVPEPEFALVGSNSATDGNAASAGYVKGAYNAAIKAINKVNANVNANLATTGGAGIVKEGNVLSVDMTENGGLQTTGSGDAATLGVKAGNGIEVGAGGVAVDAADGSISVTSDGVAVAVTSNKGLTKDGTAGTLEVDAGNGISLDSNGVNVQAKDGSIVVDSSGVSVGLTANGGVVKNATNNTLELKVDNSTVEVDATNGVQVKDGGITVAKIATDDIAKGTGTYATSTDLANQGYVDQAIAGLATDYATKTGVDKTIKAVDITVTDNKTVSTSLSGTDGITATTTLTIMDNWDADTGSSTTTLATTSVNASSLGVSSSLGGTITAAVDDNSVNYVTANTAP